MWHLVLKDLKTNRKTLTTFLLTTLLMAVFLNSIRRGIWSYMQFGAYIAIAVVGTTTFKDFLSKGDLLFCSMPINRSRIIISRYIFSIIIFAFYLTLFYVLGELLNKYMPDLRFDLEPSTLDLQPMYMIDFFFYIIVFFAFFFPVFFKIATLSRSRIVFAGFIVAVVLSMVFANEVFLIHMDLRSILDNLGTFNIVLIFTITFLIVTAVSAYISVRFVRNRDF